MRVSFSVCLYIVVSFASSSEVPCSSFDVEMSADGSSCYVPSDCTSLKVDGDTKEINKYLAAVELHPSLTSLDLSRDPRRARFEGGVSIENIQTLLKVLPNTNINSLSLSFNRVGDAGLALIAQGLKETKLETLDLQTSSINQQGAEALALVLKEDKTVLSSVNLANNNIDGAAAHLLDATKSHSKLSHIGIQGTSLGRSQSFEGRALRSLLRGECVPSEWSDWSECPGSCGSRSSHSRVRQIAHVPHKRHEVKSCPHHLEESRPCSVVCDEAVTPAPIKSTPSDTKNTVLQPALPETRTEPTIALSSEQTGERTPLVPSVAAPLTGAEENEQVDETGQQESEQSPVLETRANDEESRGGTSAPHVHEGVDQQHVRVDKPPAAEMGEPTGVDAPETSQPVTEDMVTQAPSYKTRLVAFYEKYNPSKVRGVSDMLARYEGREDVLFNSLVAKYGPEP